MRPRLQGLSHPSIRPLLKASPNKIQAAVFSKRNFKLREISIQRCEQKNNTHTESALRNLRAQRFPENSNAATPERNLSLLVFREGLVWYSSVVLPAANRKKQAGLE